MGGNGKPRALDHRDAEISRLKRENEMLRAQVRSAHAEAQGTRTHFSELSATSRRFAQSMRAGIAERQQYRHRLAAQYDVSRVLAEATDLDEAAPRIFEILGERMGWEVGVLWCVDGDVLRRAGIWRSRGARPGAFERACARAAFGLGGGLPGRAWERGEPVWVEDLARDGEAARGVAAGADGLHGAFAFPIKDGDIVGVFELLRQDILPPDENLMRTASLISFQIGQFVERRRAEEAVRLAAERDRFRVALADAIRPLADPIEIQEVAARILGEHLEADRVYYSETDLPNERALVLRDHRSSPDAASVAGWHEFSTFPTIAAVVPVGHTFVEHDVARSERLLAGERDALLSFDIGAMVELPLVKAGEFTAQFLVTSEQPRVWTDGDLALIGETAERTRAAVERARVEAALRESEERFRALIGRGADMITISDSDGRIAYASPTTERVSGYTPEEFAALHPFDLIHPEDRARCEEAFQRLADEPGLSLDLQHRVRHKDGGWRWVEGTFTSQFHDPAIGGLVANVRDISRRKRAEEALRQSEEQYRTLFNSIDEGFCVIEMIFDADGNPTDYRFLETNPSFERHTGLREAEGKRMLDLAPDHDAHWFETYGHVATTGEPVRFVQKAEALGSRWFDVYAFRLGERVDRRVAVIFSDITGRIREEEEREGLRREAEEERTRLEAVLQQMPGGVFIADREGKIFLANEGATNIYGKRLRSVGECRDRTLSYPDGGEIPSEDHPLNRALAGEVVSGTEHYVLCDDGSRGVVRANTAPVRDEDGNVVAAIKALEDVTSRKEAQKALRESEERLRTVVEGAPVVLFAIDNEGVFTLLEGQGLQALALQPEEALGRSIFDLFGEATEVLEATRRALAGETFVVGLSLRDRVFETWFSPLRDGAGAVTGATGVATDITARSRAEEERDRSRAAELAARAEIEEAQRRLAFYAGAREERQIISRELHDRVAHSIAVVRQSLELYEALKERDPETADAKLKLAKEEARITLNSTRDLSMMLRHSEVEEGLEKALLGLRETSIPDGVRYEVDVRGEEDLVPTHVGNQLFLILREAVRNAANHSGCKRLSVGLEITPRRVEGRVEDDGSGFDPRNGGNGSGLRSMQERAALVGGRCTTRSSPGVGTRIEVSVPLKGDRRRISR